MGLIKIIAFCVILWSGAKTCPPSEEIAPHCRCNRAGNEMSCRNLFTSDDLDIPIKAISRRNVKLRSLKIYYSTLLFIPSNIFKNTYIKRLEFIQTDLMSFSDTDVAFEGLENTLTELTIMNTTYFAQWKWKHLLKLNHLKTISVFTATVQSIDEPFPHLPELTKLIFSDTKLSYIVDKAFNDLPRLSHISFETNHISELKRNMFPDPANELDLFILSFNEISHLPGDFFSNMPQLQFVDLGFNRMTALNEMPFSVAFKVISLLYVNENPIRCDCRMRWIIDSRLPISFAGLCSSPKILAGKQIRDLDYKSLWC